MTHSFNSIITLSLQSNYIKYLPEYNLGIDTLISRFTTAMISQEDIYFNWLWNMNI